MVTVKMELFNVVYFKMMSNMSSATYTVRPTKKETHKSS